MFGDKPQAILPAVQESHILRERDTNGLSAPGASHGEPGPEAWGRGLGAPRVGGAPSGGQRYSLGQGAGIVPRVVFKLFNDLKARRRAGTDVHITFTFLQVRAT
jgi:hypothetical protein